MMPQFRKKPVVIEAMRWPGLPDITGPDRRNELNYMDVFDDWMVANQGDRKCKYRGNKVIIPTLEGDMEAAPGDWIIRGVQGELYPCKPDIFAATYEAVEP